MKKLYRFQHYFGRMGSLSGIFVAEAEVIAAAIGKTINFGEALGKHSEVRFVLAAEDLTLLTEDQAFIAKFEEFGCTSGKNPIARLAEQEDEIFDEDTDE